MSAEQAFERKFAAALNAYLKASGEGEREEGYTLGRLALEQEGGILEIIEVYQNTLIQALKAGGSESKSLVEVSRAAEFLSESLSPFEMAHRALRDTISALHREMEERQKSEQQRLELVRQQAIRAKVEEHHRRTAFLAQAGMLLDVSLDYQTTIESVCKLVVPTLADFCQVDLVQTDGSIQRFVAAARADTEQVLRKELKEKFPPVWSSPEWSTSVLRTAIPLLAPKLTDPELRKLSAGKEHFELLKRFGLVSLIAVPLISRARTIGVLSLGAAESGREFSREDRDFAVELGTRAAISLENANLYRQAQEAIRIRDEFLSVASHELRTPITPLKLQLQAILTLANRGQLADYAKEDFIVWIQRCEQQTDRLARLVEDLLNVTRLRSGAMALNTEPLDLAQLVKDVVSRFEPQLEQVACSVALNAPAPIHGSWDKLRLEQVLVNLLHNAMKFGAGKKIQIEVKEVAGRAILTIEDEGIGIAKEDQGRIFERFERVARFNHYGGLGLGLYIVRKIVDAHEGTVTVESEPGKGAKFTVSLPLELSVKVT